MLGMHTSCLVSAVAHFLIRDGKAIYMDTPIRTAHTLPYVVLNHLPIKRGGEGSTRGKKERKIVFP